MTAELTEEEATAHLPLQIGDEMVNFSCDSTMGMFNPFHDVIDGHWSVLVTFPKDFDPVGTTELGHMAKLREEFEARNVKLFALSCDTKMSHRRWIDETQELQECSIGFPMIVDDTGEISRLLGLVRPKAVSAIRALVPATLVIVTDIDRRIRLMMQYPVSTGRNFYEIIRAIDTLQLTMFHQVATPSNWMQGEDVFIVPSLSSNAASTVFPKGFVEIRPWFRLTPQPDTELGS